MKNNVTERLNSLIQLDIDAVHAYEQAIAQIDIVDVQQRLKEFQADHQRHVQNLSTIVKSLGGTPPEFKRDFKGFLIEGFTALRSSVGTEGALKAMKTNEQLTNKTYDESLNSSAGLSPNIRDVIVKNRDDERRHLAYIEECLRLEPWKQERKAA